MTEFETETAATKPQLPAPTAAPVARGGTAVAALALIVACGALGASGWLWWQEFRQPDDSLELRLDPLVAGLRQIDAELDRLDRAREVEAAQLRAADAELAQGLKQRTEEAQALAAQLAELNRVDRRLWQLAEAEYLLQIGQQRLRTGTDVETVLQLLRQADRILANRGDPDLYPVRTALAHEIAALEAVPEVDVEGLYLRLEALAGQAAGLPLVPEPEWQQPAAESPPEQGWRQRLQDGFAAALARLSSYVRIRQRDQPLEPLLEPPVERAVRLNIELLTEQAQLALLAGNAELFNRSLQRAAQWLENYYRVEPETTAVLAAALRELAATPIVAELPELGAARRALADYLNGRHARAVQVKPTADSDTQGEQQ